MYDSRRLSFDDVQCTVVHVSDGKTAEWMYSRQKRRNLYSGLNANKRVIRLNEGPRRGKVTLKGTLL